MTENQTILLDELKLKHSNVDYKDGGFYSQLFFYSIKKGQLSIVFQVEGKPHEHIELIQSILSSLVTILPNEYLYIININGWYCEISNGDFNLEFKDGNYYIKSEHQELHDKKEIATIFEVANLNNVSYSEFKWNVLKKKSIELGFEPVKDKSGNENLYLVKAFKECYPEYSYKFNIESELKNDITIEPKKKKFLGLF